MDKLWGTVTGLFAGGFGIKKAWNILSTVKKLWGFKKRLTKETKEAIKESKEVFAVIESGYEAVRDAVSDKDITKEEAVAALNAAYCVIKEAKEAYAEVKDVLEVLEDAADALKD